MIEIYGKPGCSFCESAKMLCEELHLDFTYKTMGVDYTKEQLLELVPGVRTVPQIFVNNNLVGGYKEFAASDHANTTNSNHTGHTA